MTRQPASTAYSGSQVHLESFIEALLSEKQLLTLTNEEQVKIKSELLDRLNKFINANILTRLSQISTQTLRDFEKLVDQNSSSETLQKYLQEKIPDMTPFIAGILLDFRKTYLGLTL